MNTALEIALIGLGGVLVGALISGVVSWVLARQALVEGRRQQRQLLSHFEHENRLRVRTAYLNDRLHKLELAYRSSRRLAKKICGAMDFQFKRCRDNLLFASLDALDDDVQACVIDLQHAEASDDAISLVQTLGERYRAVPDLISQVPVVETRCAALAILLNECNSLSEKLLEYDARDRRDVSQELAALSSLPQQTLGDGLAALLSE